MQDILAASLKRLRQTRARRMRMIAILLVLSLIVSLDVFWALRQPGLTLAGTADCNIIEHTHDPACQNGDTPCSLTEHIHTIDCYSDETAAVETQLDWQKLFADYPYTEDLRKDLVGIAKTQVGYTESIENFQVDDNGIRNGFTRYGAWYGAPYNDWSAMFVSFCLHYAGADPEEFPGNTGAASMAVQWTALGKYADAGTYDPSPGDLVFFTDATVGIISEKLLSTIYVIRGDVENAVCADIFRVTDSSIAGWGIIGDLPEAEQPLPDLSNGPVFAIYASDETQPQQTPISLWSFRTAAIDEEAQDIVTYLQGRGGNYYITLLDKDNHELPKDADGNYIVEANTTYRLVISFGSPNGFESGTYEYQFPGGTVVTGGSGRFILRDNTDVGSWTVTNTGLITMIFDKSIDDRTEITISSSMDVMFPETEEPIDFDGKIKVTVNKKQEEIFTTKLTKWGSQGVFIVDPNNPTNKTDTSKIYWTVRIDGNRDSNIPGSVLTDRIQQTNPNVSHRYTASDMAAGIKFGASVKDENGNESTWHTWTVAPDDPNITWDENGWTYTIPETQECAICHNVYTLGNEGWTYYVEYTSTPNHTDIAGQLSYTNQVELDNQTTTGSAYFSQGNVTVAVFKKGTLISDASGSKYLWEIQATIPGRKDPNSVIVEWYLNDELTISKENSSGGFDPVAFVNNGLLNATVTANYYGTTITVPNIVDATENDPYAWKASWTNEGDITYINNIFLLCRCRCSESDRANPEHWYHDCVKDGVWQYTDYCRFWTEVEDTTFTVTYTTDDFTTIETYAENGNVLRNVARLSHKDHFGVAQTGANVPIPSMIEKEHVEGDSEEFPHYTITVNEAKLMLTDGSPLLIEDVMTDTLAYIKGSMIIMAEDADGNTWELYRDKDFTIDYSIEKIQGEDKHHEHIIRVKILHPQPVKYTLDYDTEIICEDPEDRVDGAVKYSNKATVTLWGHAITDSTSEKTFAEVNMAARAYKIELYKTAAADPAKYLDGATFGLFNEHGVLITQKTTDNGGKLIFETSIAEGIILRQHQLYYVQELRAPPGYQLDETKHWLCFCNDEGDTCRDYKEVLEGINAIRIPLGQNGNLQLTNELQTYILPGTGGLGIYPIILVSVTFIITPLVYMSLLKRKRERRGVG